MPRVLVEGHFFSGGWFCLGLSLEGSGCLGLGFCVSRFLGVPLETARVPNELGLVEFCVLESVFGVVYGLVSPVLGWNGLTGRGLNGQVLLVFSIDPNRDVSKYLV